ncbi:formyltransferase family protein [Nonomuraea sp. NPDC048901]|uniref:formyltransferase family protein n=1 Tax=Nonomuraea sp. NPDC048901 TaxID=3155627 RepID=UPI003410CE53
MPKKIENLTLLGCRYTTGDALRGLARLGYPPSSCITITREEAASKRVIGYADLAPLCRELDIELDVVDSYGLTSDKSRDVVLRKKRRLLLLAGWGRLVPPWFLDSLELGAYSVHTAGLPLPFGRGHAPINWSLALGMRRLFSQLFRLVEEPDRGLIAGVLPFDVTPQDDANTLHFKNSLARMELYRRHLPDMLDDSIELRRQAGFMDTWLHRRGDADNMLDWNQTAESVCDVIRAMTRPYQGAKTNLMTEQIEQMVVWRAVPAGAALSPVGGTPGEIVTVFESGEFLVHASDACVLVIDYEGRRLKQADIGRRLSCAV